MPHRSYRPIRLSLTALALAASAAFAQSSMFTYQGELSQPGGPVNGAADMRFRVYDAQTGGSQPGPTACLNDVTVTNGRFTVPVDLGPVFATSALRWLEIDVRTDAGLDCDNGTGFTTLSPRQRITAAPVATHAYSAFSLVAPDGSPSPALFVDNDGDIGIGTATPLELFDARAGANSYVRIDSANGDLHMNGGSDGHAGLFSEGPAGGSFAVVSPHGARLHVNNTGNVGVGTAAPTAKLDVRGDVRLGSSGQYFAAKSLSNDRIVRGQINANGTIDASRSSPGFTVTQSSTGVYSINFSPAFSSAPTVVVSGQAICCRARVTTTATGSAFVHVLDYSSDALANAPFHFIAVGP